ncbi:MAG: dihydrolipoyllysine-residue acetyltransferase [Gammaproteobacteria bacterium]
MSTLKDVVVPDIGGAKNVDVIELLVAPGDKIAIDSSLITLEGDKATMEIPSPMAGTVKELKVKVGDKVSQGSLILVVETAEQAAASSVSSPKAEESQPKTAEPAAATPAPAAPTPAAAPAIEPSSTRRAEVHASPGVRRLAREFGVDLTQVTASGNKNRIVKEDVQQFVKSQLAGKGAVGGGSGLAVAPMPTIDFAQFGAIETKPLSKIKKLTGLNVHRSWVTAPQVTQFGEADITELEDFRAQQKAALEKKGIKLTPLVFIMKAVVAALKAFPQFNASLDPKGEQLILKKYFHLGVAVDTPNGLVVPVIRNVDQKSLMELATELAQISTKARDKGLSMAEMQGGCFTISSLGGIGGTAFSPIVNTPEVGILGVSKAAMKPVYQNNAFVPRLMLPVSLSYDHRVIDGAEGARFIVYLTELLADIRTLLL